MNPTILLFTLVVCVTSLQAQNASSSSTATDCQFYISADDSFELFINGQLTWKASEYDKVSQKTIPLRQNDVVVISVTDNQGGPGGHFAALLLRKNEVLASSKDFRYTVKPSADFKTNPSIQNLKAPDFVSLELSFGLGPKRQPKKAWTQKSDHNTGTVHFKYVVH